MDGGQGLLEPAELEVGQGQEHQIGRRASVEFVGPNKSLDSVHVGAETELSNADCSEN